MLMGLCLRKWQMSSKKLVAMALIACSLSSGQAYADTHIDTGSSDAPALELLHNMGEALSVTSYRGIYTHEHSGNIDSIQVEHGITEQLQAERLQHLSGFNKAIIQRSDTGLCSEIDPETSNLPRSDDLLDEHYRIQFLGEDKVAGRKAFVVNATPRDEYRHGFRLAVDAETFMPLMMMIIQIENSRVLDRFQFVSFEPVILSENDELDEIQPEPNDILLMSGCVEAVDLARWRLGWVPNGFQLVSAKVSESTDMLAFSDGISRFSVFVSSSQSGKTLEGEARRGGTLVYLDKVVAAGELYQVSVVGEVPINTARKVASALIPLAKR